MYSTTNLVLLSDSGSVSDSIIEIMPKHFNCQKLIPTNKKDKTLLQANEHILKNAHVIILNLTHSSTSSNQIISKLKSMLDAPLIVLHHYHQKVFADAFIKMGASAYLPINFQSEELLSAIKKVLEGKILISSFCQ